MAGFVLWIITLLFLVGGLIGTIVPGLPGVALAFVGILVYAISTDFAEISIKTVIVFGAISLLAWFISYVGSVAGAKAGGGQGKALTGAFIGAILGLTIGPLGLFVGAFVGSLLGATLEGKSQEQAFKVAVLSVLGIVSASIIQFLLAVIMIVAFLAVVIF